MVPGPGVQCTVHLKIKLKFHLLFSRKMQPGKWWQGWVVVVVVGLVVLTYFHTQDTTGLFTGGQPQARAFKTNKHLKGHWQEIYPSYLATHTDTSFTVYAKGLRKWLRLSEDFRMCKRLRDVVDTAE